MCARVKGRGQASWQVRQAHAPRNASKLTCLGRAVDVSQGATPSRGRESTHLGNRLILPLLLLLPLK
jgi:hypothetical protein